MKFRLPSLLMVFTVGLSAIVIPMFLLLGVVLMDFKSERDLQQQVDRVSDELDALETALKVRVYMNLSVVSGVKALVAMNPELTQEDFSRAMSVQFDTMPDLRNIALARDMVLRLMYPVEGNEAAIGLDYRTVPEQLDAVKLALELNRIVLAGPLPMVQGGEGLIARIPIHVTDGPSDQEKFWGFASVAMDPAAIFAGAGITEHPALRIALRGRDGSGEEGAVFFGDPQVFDNKPLTQRIELTHGSWQMAAVPAGGWSRYAPLSDPLMWLYFAVVSAILLLCLAIIYLLAANRKAMYLMQRERDLFAEGPVFNIEWEAEREGNWPVRNASTNVERILGYSPAEMRHPGFSYIELIHPDDVQPVIDRLRQNIAHHVDRFEESYRLRVRSGCYVWFYGFTLLQRDNAGRVTEIRSYLYDQSERKRAEEALRVAEQRLEKTAYDLTENIPVGTYTMVLKPGDALASFAFMSSRFLEITGLTAEAARENPLTAFACVHPEDFDDWVRKNEQAFIAKSRFREEARVMIDGKVSWVVAESIPRQLGDGTWIWEGAIQDITAQKQAELELREATEQLIATTRLNSRIEERERMLQDLHDGFANQLAIGRLRLRRGAVSVAEAATILDDCLDDLKLLFESLDSESEGLLHVLVSLKQRIESRARGLQVSFCWDIETATAVQLEPRALLQAGRIVQEAVANSVRHAQATTISVTCNVVDGIAVLCIEDDGHGFDARCPTLGRGLVNMRRRAAHEAWQLDITSDTSGTRVCLKME